jgi:phosphinothricin acetyltransferase
MGRVVEVRAAIEADFAAIAAIYAHHVRTGTGTFALEAPSQAEMTAAFQDYQKMKLPYLVSVAEGAVTGFAYASPFRTRPGYRYGVEDSVYIAPDHTGQGIGKALLGELIAQCTARGLYYMYGVIGDSANAASIGLHKACGFVQTGTLPRAGFKFGRWLDVVFMTRALLPETDRPDGEGWAG